jgi:hypothetical protein
MGGAILAHQARSVEPPVARGLQFVASHGSPRALQEEDFMRKLKTLGITACILLVIALVAGAVPALAQGTVRSVRIAVVDPSTGNELSVLSPGQEITMSPGEELMLRLFEPVGSRKVDRRVLPVAQFGFGGQATPLEIISSSPERGEVLVRLNDTAPGQRWHVGYRLADRIGLADTALQLGRVVVRVANPGTASTLGSVYQPSTYGSSYGSYAQPVDDVVTVLYRGILLREPDPGASGARDDLARHGYDALARVASNIANSPESRELSYRGGVTSVRRLDALYAQLLGLSRSQVNRDQWQSDLAQIESGNVAAVVDAMVRSSQFRSRFGL